MAGEGQKQEIGDFQGESLQVTQAGRDAIVNSTIIKQSYFSLFGQQVNAPDVDWDRAMQILKQEMQPEIKKRLRDSLFGWAEVDAIEVKSMRVEDEPSFALEAVKRLSIDGTQAETIDPHRPIIKTYAREDIKGKLLILGSPGAGKTITLLKLAEQLVGEAIEHPKTVIPIIFELSTWRDGQEIEAWLIEQLYENYGGNRKRKIYETWLERRVLLPLMDGLDELGMVRQQACTQKVNEFARTYPQVVVCCRVKEFQQAGVSLSSLRGIVELQPLTDGQIQDYLGQVGRLGLWEQIQTVPEMGRLLEPVIDLENPEYNEPGLLQMPLFISLAAQVYELNKPLKGKVDLFERYVDRQLSWEVRESDRSRKEFKNRRWEFTTVKQELGRYEVQSSLVWVAQQLRWRYQVELLIEKMQPSWLASRRKLWWYRIAFSLIFGLLTSKINDISLITDQRPLISFIAMSVVGYFGFSQDPIEPTERLSLKKATVFRAILYGILLCFIIILIAIPIRGVVSGLITGALFGLPLGLFGAVFMLCKQDLKIRLEPNQGIWESAKKSVLLAFLYYPFAVFGAIGISPETSHELANLFLQGVSSVEILLAIKVAFLKSMFAGFSGTLLVAIFIGGGKACLQHISLRLLLTCSDRIIPWNLARFLNYCHERRLLQRIGGRYRFIHRELLEYFAGLE